MCNSFIKSVPSECIESGKTTIVCRDKGPTAITIEAKPAESNLVFKIHNDGCLDKSEAIGHKKCDFIVLKVANLNEPCKITKIAFCELKGSDIKVALEQVIETAKRTINSTPEFSITGLYFLIASSKVPNNYKETKEYKFLLSKYKGCKIEVKSSGLKVSL